jgi:MFS family permease
LIGAQLMSSLAVWLDIFLIFSVPSFSWAATPRDMAALAACLALPSLLLGPLAGALADRHDPRLMALGGVLARVALSIAAAFAPGFMALAAIVLFKGLANLAYFPAMAVVTNRAVEPARRVGYFSALSLVDQGAKVGTPLLAGVLTLAIPSQEVFLMAALAAALCGACLLYALRDWQALSSSASRRPASLYRDLLQTFKRFRHLAPSLRVGLLLSVGVSAALAIYDPHVAAYLAHHHWEARLFAHIMTATAAGAIGAAALVRLCFQAARPERLRLAGLCCFCLALILLATTVSVLAPQRMPAFFVPLWFINGFGFEMFVLANVVIIQNHSPPDMIGKISSSVRSMQMACMAGMPGVGAALITHQSREMPFWAAAVLSFALLLVCGLSMRSRA